MVAIFSVIHGIRTIAKGLSHVIELTKAFVARIVIARIILKAMKSRGNASAITVEILETFRTQTFTGNDVISV